MITIGITDDEPLFAAGLSMILNAQPDIRVVWHADEGGAAFQRQEEEPVDIVLMDIQMPGIDGITATRQLVSEPAPARVIVLTTFDTDRHVLSAIEVGAAGFLLKNTPPAGLVSAIETVHRGDAVISPGPTRRLFDAYRGDRSSLKWHQVPLSTDQRTVDSLSNRERDVLTLIANGLTNQEICDHLWLSMPTIKTHIGNLIAKTASTNRVQLALFAFRTGVVATGP